MRLKNSQSIRKGFALLLDSIKAQGTNKPQGWWDTDDIRRVARYSTATAASSKAKMLWLSGLLEREPYQKRVGSRQTKMAYAYRPKDPKMSWDEICEAHKMQGADPVPAGWICVCEFARKYRISLQAIFQMVRRHRIPCKPLKVRRGFFGLKRVYHYPEAELCKRHKMPLVK